MGVSTGINGQQIQTGTIPVIALQPALQWSYYVSGWSVTPTVNSNISSGTVYNYTYTLAAGGTVTYYRLVPNSSANVDSFYTTFSGGVLSGLLAAKPLAL